MCDIRDYFMPTTAAPPGSSRVTEQGAGWAACSGPGAWRLDVPANTRPLSWIRPSVLWRARNDVIARRLHDPTDDARSAWVHLARERARATEQDPDFVVRVGEGDRASFVLLGDTGEGDDSQYAVVPDLLARADGVDLAVICSDVNYPTGDSIDYRERFYRPYRNLLAPILAVPGNHDWYDGLVGFMHHLCGLDAPGDPAWPRSIRGRLGGWLWRKPPPADPAALAHMAADRARDVQRLAHPQPGPYLAIDVGAVRLVGIDTGIKGTIDAEQAAWLRRVSFDDPRPKVLITGKPIYVDGEHHPCRIVGETKTVDDVVRDARANYVAAIGGDIHNYQRYPVSLPDGRTVQYVVSGGGGAFMHATHQIPRVRLPGVDEADFRCYPLRGDSLARYSQLYDRRLAGGRGHLELSPVEAASYMADLLDDDTTRGDRVRLSLCARVAGRIIQNAPGGRGFHRLVSEFFDWNDPPLFKSFLRVDVTAGALRVRCYGVSGCAEAEGRAPVEDDWTVALSS